MASSASITAPAGAKLKLLSWNVNGIRACDKKGFRPWLDRNAPFLAGIQEVRARPEQLPLRLSKPRNWHHGLVHAERKGYSGVAFYCKQAPDSVETSLGNDDFDLEGRLQLIRFGKLVVANVYFPNGNGQDRDNSRVPYKLAFYQALEARLACERDAGYRVLVMGDFNTAHKAIDLARPKTNTKTSGFLEEERVEIDRWLDNGWVDTFRAFEPGPGHYSWWSQRLGARERNVGWRIDYVFACAEAMPFVTRAFIQPDQLGSDHCPVGVEVDPAILE